MLMHIIKVLILFFLYKQFKFYHFIIIGVRTRYYYDDINGDDEDTLIPGSRRFRWDNDV